MIEFLRDILVSDVGSFGFGFSLFFFVAFGIYKGTRLFTEWQMKAKDLEGLQDKTDKLHDICCANQYRLTNLEEKTSKFEYKVDKLEDKINDLGSGMSYIKSQLNMISETLGGNFIQSHSPISLNELGKKVAEELNVSEMIDSNWDKISAYLDANLKSKNAYDIQQYCVQTATISLESFLDDKDIDRVKLHAYNLGKHMFMYGNMIGVLIRDKYFEQKGINTTLVDECDPNKN